MADLIKALQIFLKYKNVRFPFVCEHDMLHVVGYGECDFTPDDVARLRELGFFNGKYPHPEDNPEDVDTESGWYSFRYGSA